MSRPKRYDETCTFPDCGRPHRSKGLCRSHYAQSVRGVPLTPIKDRGEGVPDTCTFDGCTRPYVGRGYCMTHYQQQRRGRTLKPIGQYVRKQPVSA